MLSKTPRDIYKLLVKTVLKVGGSTIDAKAIVDIESTTKGVLFPRMTTTQRDAISSPTAGLMIDNTTTNQFERYDATAARWKALGSGSGEGASGNPKRLACKTIDGSINAINTNIALVTVANNVFEHSCSLFIYNNSSSVATIRVAHIVNGGVGAITPKDYLIYDAQVLGNESLILQIDSLSDNDTLMIRSDVINVNFVLSGSEDSLRFQDARLGSIDIDGSTNVVDTDYEVFTSAYPTNDVSFIVCNRSSSNYPIVKIAYIDSNDIGDIADEDYILDIPLQPNETKVLSLGLNMAVDNMISFKSDSASVNIIAYGKEVY